VRRLPPGLCCSVSPPGAVAELCGDEIGVPARARNPKPLPLWEQREWYEATYYALALLYSAFDPVSVEKQLPSGYMHALISPGLKGSESLVAPPRERLFSSSVPRAPQLPPSCYPRRRGKRIGVACLLAVRQTYLVTSTRHLAVFYSLPPGEEGRLALSVACMACLASRGSRWLLKAELHRRGGPTAWSLCNSTLPRGRGSFMQIGRWGSLPCWQAVASSQALGTRLWQAAAQQFVCSVTNGSTFTVRPTYRSWRDL